MKEKIPCLTRLNCVMHFIILVDLIFKIEHIIFVFVLFMWRVFPPSASIKLRFAIQVYSLVDQSLKLIFQCLMFFGKEKNVCISTWSDYCTRHWLLSLVSQAISMWMFLPAFFIYCHSTFIWCSKRVTSKQCASENSTSISN